MYPVINHSTMSWLIGEWDLLLRYLVLFMIIDYLIGMARSIRSKQLSSRFGWAGILRKFSVILVVLMANALDQLLINEGEALFDVSLRTLVIWAYLINEAISILENLRDVGVYVPPPIQKALKLLKGRDSFYEDNQQKEENKW